MITAISIDDEPRAHDVISHFASKMDILDLKDSFTSPLKALEYLKNNPVDLLFLDINMPDMDGMSLLNTINNKPAVIFTTAYEEYAVESYDHEAAGYLLKPIEFPKFYKAVMRVLDQEKSSASLSHETINKPVTSLLLKSGTKLLSFNPDDVRHIEASGNYSELYLKEEKAIVDHTLSELIEEHLPDRFIRVHRSYIINMDYLQEYETHRVKVDGIDLPIGKTYRKKLKSYMASF